MKLYVVRFADNSYTVIIKAENYNKAKEKAINYIKENHQWFVSDYNFDGLEIILCDEDYII